jgi:spermidine/putrescine transport system ATP-binding protein
MSKLVQLKNIYKTFEGVNAVDGVSLEIDKGQFFSLLGPSGCGKTTLLRLIAGFEQPNSGEVLIDNLHMEGIAPNQRPTNMVFQNYAIFPHLNVEQNVAYGLHKKRISKNEKTKMIEEVLDLVGLSGFNHRTASTMSGGQKQRVALARALILKPKVLLLDEPLSALDKKLREQMQLEIRNLQRAVGITFILVTHNQEEALTMSDKVAVMFNGQVAQVATPRELYEKPISSKVASFVGAMNFIEGKIIASQNGFTVESELWGTFTMTRSQTFGNPSKTVMTLGIRPEKICISTASKTDAASVSGIIKDVAYYGETTNYKIQYGTKGATLNVSEQNSFGQMGYQIGEEVQLKTDLESLIGFFD